MRVVENRFCFFNFLAVPTDEQELAASVNTLALLSPLPHLFSPSLITDVDLSADVVWAPFSHTHPLLPAPSLHRCCLAPTHARLPLLPSFPTHLSLCALYSSLLSRWFVFPSALPTIFSFISPSVVPSSVSCFHLYSDQTVQTLNVFGCLSNPLFIHPHFGFVISAHNKSSLMRTNLNSGG